MLSDAGGASAGRKGWPPQRRSPGSVGAFTTTTSQASVALRSLTPAFNWIATAVLPWVVVVVPLSLRGSREDEGGSYSSLVRCSAFRRRLPVCDGPARGTASEVRT